MDHDDVSTVFDDAYLLPASTKFVETRSGPPWLVVHILSGICMTLILILWIAIWSGRNALSDQACTARLNVYSPLAPVIEYEHYRYHNGLHEISPYRGPPTREREAAWDRLWQFGAINIPTSEMAALNGSSDAGIYKKTQQDKGEGFNAIIEGFHMLHCLNTIRQFTYLDEFEERPIGLNKSDRANREHVDHCIESLRLTLMCKPDITPFLIKVNETKENSEIADFDSFHKCVNWDKLTAWIDENKVAV